eukprot:gene1009-25066_t
MGSAAGAGGAAPPQHNDQYIDELLETATGWRCINYRPRTSEAKNEWLNAAWLMTRRCTVADPPGTLDAMLTAAAHA